MRLQVAFSANKMLVSCHHPTIPRLVLLKVCYIFLKSVIIPSKIPDKIQNCRPTLRHKIKPQNPRICYFFLIIVSQISCALSCVQQFKVGVKRTSRAICVQYRAKYFDNVGIADNKTQNSTEPMVLLRVVNAHTSSTKRITGSRLGSGVLNNLSSRLDACSEVAFCPVSSCGYIGKKRLLKYTAQDD